MGRFLRIAGFIVFIGILAVLLLMLVIVLGSRWHVSASGFATDILELFPHYVILNRLKYIGMEHMGMDLTWLPDLPQVVVKERLGVLDALVNAFSLFVSTTALLLVLLLAVILAILELFWGLFAGDWDRFLTALFYIVVSPFLLLLLLAPVLVWVMMFFQPCTPGYFLVWLILGLPAIGGGIGTDYLVFYGATVIVMPE